ncbi:MAG TPA: SurA N-terminal domain-containing protein [Terriglobales bacterium]|nr:SurA N-terminal domain-containing protein [Terriglobales bacterium]
MHSGNRLKISLVAAAVALALTVGCTLKTPGGDVAATVDGEKIYRADLEGYFQRQTAGATEPLSEEQATGLRLSILETLIDNQILIHQAGKLGLLATDDEVDRELKKTQAPYNDKDFEQMLKQRNLSMDDFKREIRRSLTTQKVLNREVTSKINISEQDISAYYNQHRAEFNVIEPRYHLARILVAASANAQGLDASLDANKVHNEAEARKKIDDVLGKLEAGADFSSLAMTYSEDGATAANGGDMGIVPESSLQAALKRTDPATRENILKLKPGQYTPVMRMNDPAGFQIVKLISVEPAGLRELSDQRVQQDIRKQLQDRREQLLKTAYFEVMRSQAKIRNYYAEQVLASNGSGH